MFVNFCRRRHLLWSFDFGGGVELTQMTLLNAYTSKSIYLGANIFLNEHNLFQNFDYIPCRPVISFPSR